MRTARRFIRRLPNLNWISVLLVPVAVVLMEVFWFYPWLVWVGRVPFFAGDRPPLSLASVIVLLGASYAVTLYLLSRNWSEGWTRAGVVGFGLVLVYAAIRSEYHAGYGLADPQWFVYIGRAILNLFSEANLLVVALPATVYLWWRGIDRGRRSLLVGDLYRTFLIGVGSFVLLIIAWRVSLGAGSLEDLAATVAPQIAAFFFFGLSALALTNLTSIRQRMAPEESMRSFNRRWIPTLFGVIAGIVLIGVAVAGVFSPEFMAFLGRLVESAFDVAREVFYYLLLPFGYIAAALVYVGMWLINLIRRGEPPEFQMPELFGEEEQNEIPKGEPLPEIIGVVLKWVLFAVVAILVTYFLVRAVSRFRISRARSDVEEVNESLWSWQGFKADLVLFFNSLWQRLLRRRKRSAGPEAPPYWYGVEEQFGSGRLSIREIYCRLLWQGSRFGVPHRDWETPYEYDRRLGHVLTEGAGELAELTDLYVGVRYGDTEPPEWQVDHANSLWRGLRQLLQGHRGRPSGPMARP